MAINSYDIVSTLQALGMMKYWKGKHIILKKQVSEQHKLYIYLYYNKNTTREDQDIKKKDPSPKINRRSSFIGLMGNYFIYNQFIACHVYFTTETTLL